MDINQKISTRIRRLRNEKRLKASYVAYKLNLSEGSYSQLENGKVEIKLSKLIQVSEILDVPLNSILPINFKDTPELMYLKENISDDDNEESLSFLISKSISILNKVRESYSK